MLVATITCGGVNHSGPRPLITRRFPAAPLVEKCLVQVPVPLRPLPDDAKAGPENEGQKERKKKKWERETISKILEKTLGSMRRYKFPKWN